jgi:hypothetical protein
VVNAGLGGRAAQLGRGESLLREIAALDEAVEAARRFAGEDAVIIVAGLANTGGLQLNAFSFAPDRGIAVLSPSTAGTPALSWSTGPPPQPEAAIRQSVATTTERPLPTSEDVLILGTQPPATPMHLLPDLHQILKLDL